MISIERVLPGTVPAGIVRQFLREAFAAYPEAVGELDLVDWPEKLASRAECFCLRREDGTLSAALFAYLNDMLTRVGFIPFICTLPGCEKEVAYKMHEAYVVRARKLGMHTLRLEVVKSNYHAHRFYLRQGYVVTEDRADRNRFLMELNLRV